MGQETNPIVLFSWGWIEGAHERKNEGRYSFRYSLHLIDKIRIVGV